MDKLNLLKKLKALVDDTRGNSNERNNAEEQLNILMRKYNISEEELAEEIPTERAIEYSSEFEKKLACQILHKLVTGRDIKQYKSKRSNFNRTHILCDMTNAELIEFEYLYSIYKRDLNDGLNFFFLAFINKNRIFPNQDMNNEDGENKDCTMSDEEIRKVLNLMGNIDVSTIRKEITDGKQA